MKVFNYLKVLGAFVNSSQPVVLPLEPTDRQERKLLEEARQLWERGWERKKAYLQARAERTGDSVDLDYERNAFLPVQTEKEIFVPFQYVQDYMVRRMAGVQANASIHSTSQVNDLKEVFSDYGIRTYRQFNGMELTQVNWTAKAGQQPKVMLHAKERCSEEVDSEGVVPDDVCIRFEASSELAQKLLIAIQATGIQIGDVFSMKVSAEDPAFERNRRAGREVMEFGRYVNHNLLLMVGEQAHNGRPPKGERFVQKLSFEYMEAQCRRVQRSIQVKEERLAA